MLGELILVRHGVAESKDTAKMDADRKLTEEGAKEFEDFMPELIPLLKDKDPLYIWTSPLVRAKETADILTAALGREAAEDKEFLGNGDSNALLQALQQLEDGFTVVGVGHEPYLSMWVKELTDQSLPFPKGAALSIQLNDKDSTRGKVDWKLAPGKGGKWGKAESSSHKKGKNSGQEDNNQQEPESDEQVLAVLREQLEAIRAAYRNFINNPYEPETTHQLRVNLRRMRGLLNFLKPTMEADGYTLLNDSLREAGNRLGTLRELDVLIAECTDLANTAPNLIDNYADVFRFLHEKRNRELQTLVSYSSMKDIEQLIEEAGENLAQLHLKLTDRKETEWGEFLANRLEKKQGRLRRDFKEVDHADYAASHQVRIQAKKVRYAANGFGKLMKAKTKKISKRAEALQEELGRYCDLHINAQTLESYAQKTEDPPLQEAFRKLSQHQFEERRKLLEENTR